MAAAAAALAGVAARKLWPQRVWARCSSLPARAPLTAALATSSAPATRQGAALRRAERPPNAAAAWPEAAAAWPLSRAQLNRALLDAPSASHVLCLWEAHGLAFNDVNFSTALLSLARRRSLSPAPRGSRDNGAGGALAADRRFVMLAREICRQIEAHPTWFDSRSLATIAQAAAKLRLGPDLSRPLLGAVAAAAEPRAPSLDLRHLAQLAHAYALAGAPAPRLFAAIARASSARLEPGPAPAAGGPETSAAAGPAQPRDGQEACDSQALSNLGWAFARAGVPAPALFSALDRAAAPRVRQFGGGELSMLLWAFARAAAQPPALLGALDALLARREGAPALSPRELSLMAWAAVSLGSRPPHLLARAAKAATDEPPARFDDQALCNLSWALARAQHDDARAADALAAAALPRVLRLRPAELAMLSAAVGRWSRARASERAARAGSEEAPRGGEPRGAELHAALRDAIEAAALASVRQLLPSELASLFASLSASASAPAPASASASAPASTSASASASASAPASASARLFGALAHSAAAQLDSLQPREVASICRSLAHVHLAGARAPGGRSCGAIFFEQLGGWEERRLAQLAPAELVQMLWASAIVNGGGGGGGGADGVGAAEHSGRAGGLLVSLCAAARPHVPHLPPAQLATLAVACARAPDGAAPARLLEAVAGAAAPRVAELRTHDFCSLAWAAGKARVASPALWRALAGEAEARAPALQPAGLAILAAALAAAPGAPPDAPHGAHARAFVALAARGALVAPRLSARDLSSVAWAFGRDARRARAHGALFAALAPRATAEVERLVERSERARGRGGAPRPEAAAATTGVGGSGGAAGGGDAQLVSNLAWAFSRGLPAAAAPHADEAAGPARARAPLRALLCAAALWGAAHPAAFGGREALLMAEAFARARIAAPELFDALAPRACELARAMAPRELGTLAWAYAVAGGGCAPRARSALLDAILAAAARAPEGSLGAPELARLAWASEVHAASPGAGPRGAMGAAQRALWARVGAMPPAAWTEPQRRALGQAALSARAALAAAPPDDGGALLRVLECRLGDRPPSRPRAGPAPLYTQLELSERLRARGWAHSDEVALAGGWLVVDMADQRSRVALEFDGPSHFLAHTRTGALSADGPTAWKSAALSALGWRVVRVSYVQWAEASRSRPAHEAFLDRLLAALQPTPTERPDA